MKHVDKQTQSSHYTLILCTSCKEGTDQIIEVLSRNSYRKQNTAALDLQIMNSSLG